VFWEHFTVNFDDPNNLPDAPKPGVAYTHPFLSDNRVRQALSYAINRQDISNRVYYGMRPKNVFIYDPGKADTLLKQAGLTKGRPPTELTVSTRCRLSSNSTSRLVST